MGVVETYVAACSYSPYRPEPIHLALSLLAHIAHEITHVLILACAQCSYHVYIAAVFPVATSHQLRSDQEDQYSATFPLSHFVLSLCVASLIGYGFSAPFLLTGVAAMMDNKSL